MSNIDDSLLRHLFFLEEEEKQDQQLCTALKKVVTKVEQIEPSILKLNFNDLTVVLIFYEEYHYKIYLSDYKLYYNSENSNTKMSKDRILFYLNIIISNIMYGR